MNVGFTGTRTGMSAAQSVQLRWMLAVFANDGPQPRFHYGTHETATLLADSAARDIADRLGYECVSYHAVVGEELDRDRQLVAESHVLVAAPRTDKEEQRSGTWATVRYARRRGIPVVMLSRGER